MRKNRRLHDAYRFPGFRPEPTVRGLFGDPKACLVRLVRRGKKLPTGPVGESGELSTITRSGADKFHVLKHLGVAMDEVRKQEYARLSGKCPGSA
jgi:hypothetical protein